MVLHWFRESMPPALRGVYLSTIQKQITTGFLAGENGQKCCVFDNFGNFPRIFAAESGSDPMALVRFSHQTNGVCGVFLVSDGSGCCGSHHSPR